MPDQNFNDNKFTIENDGTIRANTASYKTLVNADGDIPDRGYISQRSSNSTVDPTGTDDITAGYLVSDIWTNTTSDRAFICVDNTGTAAIWHMIEHSASDIWERAAAIVSLANAGDEVRLDATGGLQFGAGGQNIVEFSTDGTLAGNSDTVLPTEKAAKTYTDTSITTIVDALQQPLGFPNRTDSEILYDSVSRQITIQPKAPATEFDYFINGVKHTVSTPQSLTHADATGTYFFYWDSTNTLQFGTTVWDVTIDVQISFVYYSTDFDGVGGNDGYRTEERHASWTNPASHLEFHEEIGTYIIEGFAISGYTLQPGSPTDADNTYALAVGKIADEDIRLDLPALADGGPYTAFRRIGASGAWEWDKTLVLPFYTGASYIEYNEFTGAIWQLTEGANNKYYNYYVMKTTSIDGLFQTIIIPGQTEYSTLVGAEGELISDLSLGTLPFVEIAPLYQITFGTSAAFSSTGKCRIEQVSRLVGTRVSITTAAQLPHNSLAGLQLAQAAVTWGHIDDQAQILTGAKQFATSVQLATGATANDITTDVTLATASNTQLGATLALKTYMDNIAQGLHWQKAVKDQVDFTTAEPGGPSVGDRYINTVTGTSSGTAQSVTATYIYEWNGATWTETIPQEGYALWDEADNSTYVFNGTLWIVLGGTQSFLHLSDTPSTYATANALYKVDSGQTGVVESTWTVDNSGNANYGSGSFKFTAGPTISSMSTDGTFATASDTELKTGTSIKTYVDNHSANGVWTRVAPVIYPTTANDNILQTPAYATTKYAYQITLNNSFATAQSSCFYGIFRNAVAQTGNTKTVFKALIEGDSSDTSAAIIETYGAQSDAFGSATKVAFGNDTNFTYAFRSNSGRIVRSTSALQSIVAGTGIPETNTYNVLVESSTAGEITITANPQMPVGLEGEEKVIWGTDDTKTVTIVDGLGFKLNTGQPCTLGAEDNIVLQYRNSLWCEISRSDN